MGVLRLSSARRRYPELDFAECRDPRHDPRDSRQPVVAVVARDDTVCPVCKACLPRILGENYTDN
ncbi:MAG: hypothetical protein M1401_01350 [Chloroflexi bacterium]|nr:hypothetical protein [Chloroflexota bacterium]MCL5107523.1 hypothetical protein [Chloroflexota bacterium]